MFPIPIPSPKEIWEHIRSFTNWLKETQYAHIAKLQICARTNPLLYQYLDWLYGPRLRLLKYDGTPFPVALFPAPPEQRHDIESVLDGLDTEIDDAIDNTLDQAGQSYLKKLKETGHNLWDDPTYRMLRFDLHPHMKLTCALGGYYNMLKSCDILEFELLTEFGRQQPSAEGFADFTRTLRLRNHVHGQGDPFSQAAGRSAAIAISAAIVFAKDRSYKALLRERSKSVTVHSGLLHVVPSFMFQPVARNYREEFSVRHNVYREYLEEVLGLSELTQPEDYVRHDYFYDDPNLRYLLDLEKQGAASFHLTGVCMNLLNTRPEICVLILIRDPDWIDNQGRGRKVKNLQLTPLKTNWEFKHSDELPGTELKGMAFLDLTHELVIPPELFKPEHFVPPGAAALKLAVDVAREELAHPSAPPTRSSKRRRRGHRT